MKHLYKSLLLAVAAMASLQAHADIPGYDITIKVDDPSRVKAEFWYYNSEPRQTVDFNGANTVSVEWPNGLNLRLSATDGNILTSVTADGDEQYITNLSYSSISFNRASYNDAVFNVTSAALNRSVNVTIKTDAPERLMMFNDNTYANPNRIDGFSEYVTNMSFDPNVELPIKFNGNAWNDNIVKATCNGVDITNTSGSYYELTPTDGDVYYFYFNDPDDTKYDVTFDYGDADAGIITSVKLDGVEMADFDGSGFQVDAGTKLQIYVDTDNYEIEQITRNGEPQRYSNKEIYLDAVRENVNFKFDAHKFGLVTLYITVDDAAGVQVCNSSYNNHKPLELVDGENEVQVDERVSQYLCIVSDPDYRLLSVDINDFPMDRQYINYYKYAAGDHINITTEALVRDGVAYVYIDRPQNVWVFRDNESVLSLEAGFNRVPISPYDSPFTIYHPPYATVNDARLINEAEDDYIYYPILEDGDVLKMYFEGVPDTHRVNIDASAAEGKYEILKDFSLPMSSSSSAVIEHASHLTVVAREGADLTVTANGVAVPATEVFGVTGHHIDVTVDHDLVITNLAGINEVVSNLDTVPADVYGLDGVLIKRNATADDVRALAPGFYIVGGQKVVR